jgi:hypothetical protein
MLFSSCTKDYFWLIAGGEDAACGSKNRSVDSRNKEKRTSIRSKGVKEKGKTMVQ